MTKAEHDAAVLAAHKRYADALAVIDGLDRARERAEGEFSSAHAELQALARRQPK